MICKHFGYDPQYDVRIIPNVKLSDLILEDVLINICKERKVDGNVSLYELIVINSLIQSYNPSKLFEIGTFNGRTTCNMSANCSPESTVYTLDLPKDRINFTKLPIVNGEKIYIKKNVIGCRYLGTDYEKKIVQLFGDSATFDFSQFFNKIDFVFVDGSHSYEYVLNDSKKAIKLLRNRLGVILWHDYGVWEGVTRVLNFLYKTDRNFKDLKHIEGTSLAYLRLFSSENM
ncbi:MAG: class I SAM-dependent methyltransferase [bacterium]|nr:class I SAM-dependent methyltransferase [bacterium]